ncbi:hypothetical protein J6590_104846, partial [Homalodisca vitripennis]
MDSLLQVERAPQYKRPPESSPPLNVKSEKKSFDLPISPNENFKLHSHTKSNKNK